MVSNSFYFQPGHWGHDPFGRIFFNLGWSHLAYIHFDNFEKFCLLPLGLIYAILVHACSTWLRFVDPLDEKVYGIHLPRQRAFFASCKEIMRRKTPQAQKPWDFGAKHRGKPESQKCFMCVKPTDRFGGFLLPKKLWKLLGCFCKIIWRALFKTKTGWNNGPCEASAVDLFPINGPFCPAFSRAMGSSPCVIRIFPINAMPAIAIKSREGKVGGGRGVAWHFGKGLESKIRRASVVNKWLVSGWCVVRWGGELFEDLEDPRSMIICKTGRYLH